MERTQLYKEKIHKIAMEKKALSLTPIIEGAKDLLGTAAETGLGKTILNSGVGTKMAIGAGAGALINGAKTPGANQDRVSNAVSGAFNGATAGLMAHGVTSGVNSILTPKVANIIEKMYFEKIAGLPEEAIKASESVLKDEGKNVIKDATNKVVSDNSGSLGNGAKRLYNHTLGANVLKTTAIGTGLGGAVGAYKYNENQDDGSFEHSRFGAMTGGALAGAGAGLATGLLFKKIPNVPKVPNAVENVSTAEKVAEYREFIYDIVMEKKAASVPQTLINGAKSISDDYKNLSRDGKVLVGSSIGATVGLIAAIEKQKGTNTPIKSNLKVIGKDVFRGAMVGGSIAGVTSWKPGQMTKDINTITNSINNLKNLKKESGI